MRTKLRSVVTIGLLLGTLLFSSVIGGCSSDDNKTGTGGTSGGGGTAGTAGTTGTGGGTGGDGGGGGTGGGAGGGGTRRLARRRLAYDAAVAGGRRIAVDLDARVRPG